MADTAAAPYRTPSLQCPRCKVTALGTGTLRSCGACHGAWVPEETLVAHVSSMQSAPPRLHWSVAIRPALPCARCQQPMETLWLFHVAVDRCRSHGVWFDEHELAEVLRRAHAAERTEQTGVADGIELVGVGLDAADVGVVVVEAGLESAGVLEGILDVLGGIFSVIDL